MRSKPEGLGGVHTEHAKVLLAQGWSCDNPRLTKFQKFKPEYRHRRGVRACMQYLGQGRHSPSRVCSEGGAVCFLDSTWTQCG